MSETSGWTPPEQDPARPAAPLPGTGPVPPVPPVPASGWAGYAGWSRPGAVPGVIPLRPLGLGEILDGALTTLRHYPRTVLSLSALVVTLSELLQFLVQLSSVRAIAERTTPEVTDAQFTSYLGGVALAGGIAILASFVLAGMLAAVMGQAVLGRPMSLGDAWRQSRRRIAALVGTATLTVVLVTAGALLVLPGIYLYVALSLATPALVLEDRSVTGALARSRELVRGDWWRCCGILLLATLIALVLQTVLTAPFGLAATGLGPFGRQDFAAIGVGSLVLESLGGVVAGTVVLPFLAGVTALLYVDRRIRVEGLDVALARAAAAPPGDTG